MGQMIGIDLGTTNSCVAVLEGGRPTVIHNRQGERTLPSVVAFNAAGEVLVGSGAKRQAITNPGATVFGAKRLIGRKQSAPELVDWVKTLPFGVVAAPNGDAWIQTASKRYSPQEISAYVLEEIKAVAEEYLGEAVTEAVITVPAYFNDSQRQATKDAGRIAGLEVNKIINEPTAAALAYGLEKAQGQTIAVFDLGGGTFDISILKISDGVFEVLATNGDTFLGGDDFDHRLIQWVVGEFAAATGINLNPNPGALARIKEAAEQAKRELSSTTSTRIHLPFIDASGPEPLHIQHDNVERALLEDLTKDLIERLELPCLTALDDAKLTTSDINQVLLVGGMSRMPAVQRKVEAIFGIKPVKGANPDEIVALGAAMQCAIMAGDVQEVVLLDITPHSLGVKTIDDRMSVVIPKNSTVPASEKKVFGTTVDNQEVVVIEVYQGEAELVANNTYLGRFKLVDLPRKAAGKVFVEVTFVIDADGVVNVTARELATGLATSIEIAPSGGLSDNELEALLQEHLLKALE